MSAIVFLPGLLCDEALWIHQVAELRDLAPCIVIDLTKDDSISAMAERVAREAPSRFVVVASSMGGYVAFELIRRFPERLSALALLDTSAAPDSPDRAAQRRAGIEALAHGRFQGVTGRLLPKLLHARHVNGAVGNLVRAMALRVGKDAYIRQQRAILGRIDSRPFLNVIKVPTLVAVGQQDAVTPHDDSFAIHAAIPHSQMHVFANCGHLPPIESPHETTILLKNWITKSSGLISSMQ